MGLHFSPSLPVTHVSSRRASSSVPQGSCGLSPSACDWMGECHLQSWFCLFETVWMICRYLLSKWFQWTGQPISLPSEQSWKRIRHYYINNSPVCSSLQVWRKQSMHWRTAAWMLRVTNGRIRSSRWSVSSTSFILSWICSGYFLRFAVLTRLASEHQSMHSKLKSGHILKVEQPHFKQLWVLKCFRSSKSIFIRF